MFPYSNLGLEVGFYFHYLHGFDTVGWVSGRASSLLKLTDEVLVWLSVWSEV